MTPEQTEKLRAQFEAWALTQGMVIERYPPHHPTWPGQYMWTTPHRDWTVWQACACLVEQDTWERAAQCGERWIHKHRTDALETQDEGCDFVDGAQGVINDIRAAAAREAK